MSDLVSMSQHCTKVCLHQEWLDSTVHVPSTLSHLVSVPFSICGYDICKRLPYVHIYDIMFHTIPFASESDVYGFSRSATNLRKLGWVPGKT